MFGRSRVSERSSGFRTLAACITVTNARQRNAMPADAFWGTTGSLRRERGLRRSAERLLPSESCHPDMDAGTDGTPVAVASGRDGPLSTSLRDDSAGARKPAQSVDLAAGGLRSG